LVFSISILLSLRRRKSGRKELQSQPVYNNVLLFGETERLLMQRIDHAIAFPKVF
jgi:hypothetical protein